jgi:hypothetical protein
MTFAKTTIMAVGLALALMTVGPAAHATVGNQLTKLTFNRSVQIPGDKTLPAGTYWFQILNNKALPNSVLIYNKNRTHVEAKLLTEPTYRSTLHARTEITLAGGSHNRPPVLVKWFYPDANFGHEFMYSQRTENRIREEGTTKILAQRQSRG